MTAALHRLVKDAHRRVMMSIGRAVLSAIDDTAKAQSLQVQLLDGETQDGVERFQEYGFSSVPHAGAEAIMASVGGLRGHGVIIAVEDRRYRLTGGAAGEVALYDDLGQVVRLTRAGIVINSASKVTVQSAAEVDVIAPVVNLGAAGGHAVARVNDQVMVGGVVGTIISGSAKVTAG
jgi:phage baseplate assembly protein V